MEQIFTTFLDLINPENIIQYGGLALLVFIIFAETGLFFGFFLPGDSLLFLAGLLSKSAYLNHPVWSLIVILTIAAVAGTTVGYGFGRCTRPYIRSWKDGWLFKQRYLSMAEDFYKRNGMLAFVAGRFLPIVRTFVPIVAGVLNIRFRLFFVYNVAGAIVWILSMVLSGYFLGDAFPALINHIELVVIGIVIVTALPVLISFIKRKRSVLQ